MFLDYMVFVVTAEKLKPKISRQIQTRNPMQRDVCYTKVCV